MFVPSVTDKGCAKLRAEVRSLSGGRAPRKLLLGASSICGCVVERNQAICITDAREQPSLIAASFSALAESVIAAPLRQSGAAAGCLVLCSPRPCVLREM